MAYAIACADLGNPCPGSFTTETSDELWDHVRMHATAAHPDLQLTPEVLQMAQGAVREV